MSKDSQEDQMNAFVANIWKSKPAEIYLRGINKQSDKSKELILNNGEHLKLKTSWNLLERNQHAIW